MTIVVSWLWQGLTIAWVTKALLGCTPRLNAATRHAIWWCALLAVLLLPFIQPATVSNASTSSTSTDAGALMPSGVFAIPAAPDWMIACAAGVWLATIVIGLVQIVSGLQRLVYLRERSLPVDPSRQARLAMWTAVRESGRRPHLRVSEHARSACVLGLGRPTILLTRDLVETLADEDLDQVVMHEHAHLERYDDWCHLLQCMIIAVVGVHPAVRLIVRALDLEREAACDDRVVARTGAPRRYASCLANAAAVSAIPGRVSEPAMLPGVTGTSSALRVRVGRLLEPSPNRDPRVRRLGVFSTLAILIIVVEASVHVSPLVVFPEAAAPAAVVDRTARTATTLRVRRPSLTVGTPARMPFQAAVPLVVPSVNRADDRPNVPPPKAILAAGSERPTRPMTSLATRTLAPVFDAPIVRPGRAAPVAEGEKIPAESLNPWAAVAASGTNLGTGAKRAGIATGAGARRAGVSIASLFGRAGKAVATSF
jgi:beta-lactamase regulating signal transducer with metallopeptidase domain